MILTLFACGGLGFDNLIRDTSEVSAAAVVDDIRPGWGMPDVETLVTITGANFTGPVSVEFGNAEVEGTLMSDRSIVVKAPAAGIETTVDVTVHTGSGTVTVPNGFTWTTDPSEIDTTETTEDTDSGNGGPDNSGKVGGFVEMNYTVYACTACFGLTNPLSVSMAAVLHTAKSGSWHDWLPARGDCEEGISAGALASTFLDAGSRLHLETSQVTVTLDGDADNVYSATGLEQTDWQQDVGFDLSGTGGTDVGSLNLADVATTPGGFDSFTPSSLIATNQADAFTARFAKSGGAVSWSPRGTEDVLVIVDIYTPQGNFQTEWVCRDDDQGTFDIPSKVFSSAQTGSLLVIGVNRYVLGDDATLDDGATVESTVSFGVIGTGIVQ